MFGVCASELEDELADLADEEPGDRRRREEQARREDDFDNFDNELSDDMDDFIDDGEGGGQARRRRRARTQQMATAAGVSSRAMEVGNLGQGAIMLQADTKTCRCCGMIDKAGNLSS